MEPAQVGLGGSPAIAAFVETRDRAVVNYLALLVAPAAINYLATSDLSDITGDDAVDEPGGIASADQVFVKRGNIDECGRIANSVVLVLMLHLVGADRVVSRPLAVVQALAKRKSSFVKGGRYGHDFALILRKIGLYRERPESRRSTDAAPVLNGNESPGHDCRTLFVYNESRSLCAACFSGASCLADSDPRAARRVFLAASCPDRGPTHAAPSHRSATG